MIDNVNNGFMLPKIEPWSNWPRESGLEVQCTLCMCQNAIVKKMQCRVLDSNKLKYDK
jgi:hypothetical protein